MTDEIREAMDLAREQVELATKNRDRSIYLSVTNVGVTLTVEPWPEEGANA